MTLSDLERPDVRNQFFFRRILITLVRSATSLHLHKCVARFVSDSRVSCLLIAPGRKKTERLNVFFGNNTDYYCLRRRRFCFLPGVRLFIRLLANSRRNYRSDLLENAEMYLWTGGGVIVKFLKLSGSGSRNF